VEIVHSITDDSRRINRRPYRLEAGRWNRDNATMPTVATTNSHLRKAAAVFVGTVAIAIGARLEVAIPGTDVPQTAQTFAVLIAGIFLGPGYGSLAVVSYVVLGVIGVPVFAGDGSGLEVLAGPTAGYLLGFVFGAAIAGYWTSTRLAGRIDGAFAGMVLAHSVILFLGWLRLSLLLGPAPAYSVGVEPFWFGAFVKSLVAAGVCAVVVSRREVARGSQ